MRRLSKRSAVVLTAVAAVTAVALPAWAYYALTSNTTNATATAAALGTPVTGTPSATALSVAFTVSAPASGLAPTGYRVDRTAPTAVSGVCAFGTGSGGTCTDSAPVSGQTNTYAVYALRGTWTTFSPATVTVAVPADQRVYSLSAPATGTAGTPFTVTITAKNGATTDTTYTGTKTLTWSGGQTVGAFAPAYQTSVSFTNGVGSASVTLYKAGAQTLTATDASVAAFTGSASVTVNAAQPALAFSTCPATATRNTSFTTTVTRTGTDPYGNSTGLAAVTVTLAPSTGNAKFTSSSTTIAVNATASGSVTVNLPNSATTSTFTASATGYTAATCAVTTS